VRSVDLDVPAGSITALLGTNGAGKTSTVELLEGLARPDGGEIRVLGLDPWRDRAAVRRRAGVLLQASGFSGDLTVTETLRLQTRLTSRARPIDEVLDELDLLSKRTTRVGQLSGGEQRRLDLACALLGDPDVLFLDEPSIGIDPVGARELRATIGSLVDVGKTVLLTTHYMQEADELCDRVAIISGGKILACDTPAALKRSLQEDVVFRLHTTPVNGRFTEEVRSLGGVQNITNRVIDDRTELNLILKDDNALPQVLTHLGAHNASLLSLEKRQPTLEDVFVSLVGHSLTESEATA